MKLIPVGVRIIVALPEVKIGKGILEIPEEFKERFQKSGVKAQVISIGPYAFSDQEECPVKVGSWVIISPYAGIRIPQSENAEGDTNQYLVLMHEDISAVVEDNDE